MEDSNNIMSHKNCKLKVSLLKREIIASCRYRYYEKEGHRLTNTNKVLIEVQSTMHSVQIHRSTPTPTPHPTHKHMITYLGVYVCHSYACIDKCKITCIYMMMMMMVTIKSPNNE